VDQHAAFATGAGASAADAARAAARAATRAARAARLRGSGVVGQRAIRAGNHQQRREGQLSHGLISEAAPGPSMMRNSTRRFFSLFALERFGTSGREEPNPSLSSREAAMPCELRYVTTAAARSRDSTSLRCLPPLLSV